MILKISLHGWSRSETVIIYINVYIPDVESHIVSALNTCMRASKKIILVLKPSQKSSLIWLLTIDSEIKIISLPFPDFMQIREDR